MAVFIVIVTGLILGSFATCLAHRSASGVSWRAGRSSCPRCGAVLGARDLVPVFSWIFQRGKCRFCESPISPLYPVIELAVMAACLGVYAAMGLTPVSFIAMLSIPFLIALAVIDLRHMILPNDLVLSLGALGMIRLGTLVGLGAFSPADAGAHIAAGAIYILLSWGLSYGMSLVLKKKAMGLGDVKFFGVAGLWLGIQALPWFCVAGGLLGLAFGAVWRLAGRGDVFPFGPALIAAFYLLLTFIGHS